MNGNSSANDIANKTLVGWIDGGTDRGTLDILYASCVTIILCIWVSTYPNVPAPSDRWYHRIVDKANLAAIGALSPDLLFALALGQYSSAKRSIKVFSSIHHDISTSSLLTNSRLSRRSGPTDHGLSHMPFTRTWEGFA